MYEIGLINVGKEELDFNIDESNSPGDKSAVDCSPGSEREAFPLQNFMYLSAVARSLSLMVSYAGLGVCSVEILYLAKLSEIGSSGFEVRS